MSQPLVVQYVDPKGTIIEDVFGFIVFASLKAAPTASAAGYQKGCIFINSAGSVGSLVYANTGTTSAAVWTNIL